METVRNSSPTGSRPSDPATRSMSSRWGLSWDRRKGASASETPSTSTRARARNPKPQARLRKWAPGSSRRHSASEAHALQPAQEGQAEAAWKA